MSEKQMTLAEAIRLGSLHMKPEGGELHNKQWTTGCAIGMAMFAHGKVTQTKLRELHPSLNKMVIGEYGGHETFMSAIENYFDYSVSPDMGNGSMTLDQLCEWVATREREFEAVANAAKAAVVAAPAKTSTKVAKKSRKTVKTPA